MKITTPTFQMNLLFLKIRIVTTNNTNVFIKLVFTETQLIIIKNNLGVFFHHLLLLLFKRYQINIFNTIVFKLPRQLSS